jgi:lipoprotein-anchoring transpeptidase ErfK/SrfK
MGKGSFILVAVLVALLLGGVAAVYAYDSGREDLIAKGVTVAGIDVGDMRRADATAILQRRLANRIERPIVVRHDGRRYWLSPRRARMTTDVGGMVAEAVSASRSDGILTRTWRGLTGGEVRKTVELRMSYSKRAVRRLVARVRKAVDRPSKDASVTASSRGLQKVASHTGVALQARDLQRRVEKAIRDPDARHLVQARTRIVQPQVSTEDLEDRYPWYIIVNRPAFRLTVYDRLRPKKTYPVAVGQVGLETPAGLYHVRNKAVNPAWHVPNSDWAGDLAGKVIPGDDPENPIKARWLGIFNGAGIHGTDNISSLGSAVSHGCIRMAIPDVIEVYNEVPVGAPVYIA